MTESSPGTNPAAHDPTLTSLNEVIETMQGQTCPFEPAGAVGAIATGGEVTSSSPAANHERPKPERWDELAEFASTLPIYKSTDPTYHAKYEDTSVDALRSKLEELLSDEELDTHRYYSIGTMLCGLSQGLHSPDQRASSVEMVGERLMAYVRLEGSGSRKGVMPEDVDGTAASSAFGAIVTRFAAAMPPHIQLLNDVLSWHASERRSAIRYGGTPADHASLNRKGPDEDNHFEAGDSALEIAQLTASASAIVLRDVLIRRAAYLKRQNPDFPREPTAQQVIDATDMDDINLETVAQRAAAMRLDEFRDIATYLGLDENGRAVFHGKKLPRSRDLAPPAITEENQIILHTKRLRCPAIFVEGLIPDMLHCLVDGIKAADGLQKEAEAIRRRWETGR